VRLSNDSYAASCTSACLNLYVASGGSPRWKTSPRQPAEQIDASGPVVGGGGSGYTGGWGGGDSGGVRILFNGGFTYPTGDR
jgi:hypothetical protein